MKLHIGVCGSHSITGVIMEKVFMEGLNPDVITIDIDEVMEGTDVSVELARAKQSFNSKPYRIELGAILRNRRNEALTEGRMPACCS